jgi:hypothetical protein
VTVNQQASEPAWRVLREPPLRQIACTLLFSALLHALLTPLAGLLGLFAWLWTQSPPDDTAEAEQLRSIPITFLGYEEAPTESAPPQTLPADPVNVPKQTRPVPALTDAKPEPKVEAKSDEKRSSAPTTAKPAGEMAHPVAMAGVASEVVDSNANVNLLLLSERVRQHPLGERIGRLIVNFPQWSSFFESAEIDPVRDINRILIVGPQFRRSADVVAVLHHGLPERVVKAAVDRLVQRPPRGRWLKGKISAARAHADRAERVFALTAPHILVVAPPHLEKQIMAAPPTEFPTPEGEEALILHVKTPWRALIGLPFSLPESLAWLRLDVLPLEDGGARLRLTAEDADAKLASAHAQSLTMALNAVTNPDLGPLGALVGLRSIAFIDKMQFEAQGRRISGQVRVTPRQLDRLLAYAEEMVIQWTGRRNQAPAGITAPLPKPVPGGVDAPRPRAPNVDRADAPSPAGAP